MIAVPRYPARRKEPALRRFFRAIRRHWLLFQIDGARMNVQLYQRLIDNDAQVAAHFPEQLPYVLPAIANYEHAQQAEAQRLTQLNLKLIAFDHSV